MCLAVAGKIIEISGHEAIVSIMDVETTVNLQLIEDPVVGEYVLVHIGVAIEKVDQTVYKELNCIYNRMIEEGESHASFDT